ncbi:MAG: protein kinase [Pyrinomonadaceae bacterium]|nr:protein kinase [Pyrinomonadaceae bacterium]
MPTVNPEKWQTVKEILYAALRHSPAEREKFLDELCQNDADLRREVESLILSSEEAGTFMQNPAVNEVADVITENKEKLRADQHFSHYKIIKSIGAGGMGEVYLGEDTKLKRKIALKILPADFAKDAERMRRFGLEAEAVSALNHPNILTIYETGEFENTNYIASEYVEGETLGERLQREPLNLQTALDIAIQVTSALQAAHGAGIIHRDIKPDNVMIRPDSLVKLLDFGIAKLSEKKIESIGAEAATAAIKAHTKTGMIIGTANYMSPEQARGKAVDARTDIFSFGLVFYETLTGRKAFAGDNVMDVIASILHKEPIPLNRHKPDVPPEIERIVNKTLKKDCEERYQTAKDLLIDLKDARQELEFQNKLERSSSAPVRESGATQIINDAETKTAHTTSSAEYIVKEIKSNKLSFIIFSVLLLAAIGFGYWFFSNSSAETTKQTSNTKQIESIAVMPFVNQSGNADTEYLSDGMTETLIGSLSQLSQLNVKSRSSVFRYKGANTDSRQIAKELNVQAVLNGRVVERGGNLSLYVELVDVAADKVIWSQTYNRQMTNLVALQAEIARDVSGNLQTKLSGADERKLTKSYTENAEAYQLYLRGNYHWNKHTLEDLQKGIGYFNQALEKDPNYALAYAGLSASYGVLGNTYLPPKEAYPQAAGYAAKALAIDDTLSFAHTTLGANRLYYDWNWAEAEKELKRAQTLDSNNAEAHLLYGDFLDILGRFDETKAERKRALELDPLSPRFNMAAGATFYFARQHDEAIAQLEKTISLEPRYAESYVYLGQAYEQKKMFAQAIVTFQKGLTQAERSPQLVAALGHADALDGERGKALKALDELREMSKSQYVSPYLFAVVYLGLGDKDQTFIWLEKAFQDRSFFLIWLKVEPLFDPLRDDSRFQNLLRRIGL